MSSRVGLGIGLALGLGCGSGGGGTGGPGGAAPARDAGASADGPAAPADVAERGRFRIGHRLEQLTYRPAGATKDRTIPFDVWYPTSDTTGADVVYFDIFRDAGAFEGAKPAAPADGAGYPVHVHSHGSHGFGATSWNVMYHFVSHGWVAVAPTHIDNTLTDTGEPPPAHRAYRSQDVSRTLDATAKLHEAGVLPAPARTDRVLLSGHSFGAGFTAWATVGATIDPAVVRRECAGTPACTAGEIDSYASLRDPRVVAAVPMAGGGTDWISGYQGVTVPVFLMTGTEDDVGAAALWDRTAGVKLTWIDITGGCHQLFAFGGCVSVPDAEGFSIVGTYALAFARRHLEGDTSARVAGILDGTVTISPRVKLKTR